MKGKAIKSTTGNVLLPGNTNASSTIIGINIIPDIIVAGSP